MLATPEESTDSAIPASSRRFGVIPGRAVRVLAIWVALVMASIGLTPVTAEAQSASDEASFISLINQVRADQGLPPLIQNNQLTSLARSWAQAQRDGVCPGDDYICHANPLDAGVTQNWSKLGENVGTGPNVNDVMDAFIASPGHYANIIDPAFTHVGVGVVWDGARLYTTHRFMALNGSTPATTAAPTTTAAPATTSAPATAPPATAAPTTATPATSPPPPPTTTAPAPTTTDAPSTTETPATTTTVAPVPEPPAVNIGPERAFVLINALAEVSG